MSRSLSTVFVIIGLASLAMAQEPGDPDRRRDRERGDPAERLERARTELGLDDEQFAKLQDLWGGFSEKLKELRNKGWGPEMKESFQAIREEMEAALSAFLSEEQMEKARNMFRGGDRRRRRESPEERDANRVKRAVEEMQLTGTEQEIIQEAIEIVLKSRRDQREAVRAKRDALKAMLDNGASDEELAAALEEVRATEETQRTLIKAAQEELDSLLTVKQRCVLVAMDVLQ